MARTINLILFVNRLDGCTGQNKSICDRISEGGRLAGRTDADSELQQFLKGGFPIVEASWAVRTAPTLVFYFPKSNGDAIGVGKLVGSQITSRNVQKMFEALEKLVPNADGNTFYNPEGDPFIKIGLGENDELAPAGGNLLTLGGFGEVQLDFDKGKWWLNPFNWLLIGGIAYGTKRMGWW